MLFVSACSKDDSPAHGVVGGLYLVKTATTTSSSMPVTTTYTYNSDNRVKKTESTDGRVEEYVYTSNTVTVYTNDNGQYDTLVHTLNSKGMVISSSNGYIYQYDADGHRVLSTDGVDSMTAEYVSGNLVALHQHIDLLDYDFDVRLQYGSKKDTRTFGMPFFGKNNVNLPVTFQLDGEVTTLTYQFDPANPARISRMTQSSPTQSSTVVDYTYW